MGLLRETAMFRNKSIKSVVAAITFGAMVSAGTYFFMPPPSSSYACDTFDIDHIVRDATKNAIADCLNRATLHHDHTGYGKYKIKTFC